MDVVREAGNSASSECVPSSSGFTAINRTLPYLSSPSQPSPPLQPHQNLIEASDSGRNRNPAIASYLGLGASAEPLHLANYAPPIDSQRPDQTGRKRREPRDSEKVTTRRKKPKSSGKKASSKQPASQNICLGATLNPFVTEDVRGKELLPTPLPTVRPTSPAATNTRCEISQDKQDTSTGTTSTASILEPPYTQVTVAADNDDDDEFGQLCFDFEAYDHAALDSPCQSQPTMPVQTPEMHVDEDDFDDDFVEEDLLNLVAESVASPCATDLDSSRHASPNYRSKPDQGSDSSGTSKAPSNVNSSSPLSKKFVSPVTPRTPSAVVNTNAWKPIVRSPFPAEVRDRSPIIGLSANKLLRTCFRVGEAINQSCQATKNGKNILIELYARVLSSERDDVQQRFTFCDLFHAKPPYIQATYAAAIWRSVELYKCDSSRLLQPGRMCRCIGTMKRNGKEWVMTVLNIWEATWDDVQWVEGIINP